MPRCLVLAALLACVACADDKTSPCDRDIDDVAADVRAHVEGDDSDGVADALIVMVDECPERYDAVDALVDDD